MSSSLPLVRDGKLLALAVSTASRSPALPDVPTTVEAGVAGSDYTFWVGMIVPSATPPAVVQRLHDEAIRALATPEVKERLAMLGAEPFTMTPDGVQRLHPHRDGLGCAHRQDRAA